MEPYLTDNKGWRVMAHRVCKECGEKPGRGVYLDTMLCEKCEGGIKKKIERKNDEWLKLA